jgi:hypothetical protein
LRGIDVALCFLDAGGYAALAKTMDPRALSALRLASREDIQYLGALTFHDRRFYQDTDAIFKQRVTAGDSYTVGQFLDSMVRGDDILDNRRACIEWVGFPSDANVSLNRQKRMDAYRKRIR